MLYLSEKTLDMACYLLKIADVKISGDIQQQSNGKCAHLQKYYCQIKSDMADVEIRGDKK